MQQRRAHKAGWGRQRGGPDGRARRLRGRWYGWGVMMLALATAASAEFAEVTFDTADGGSVDANLYGDGTHAVLLAHGAIFNKESWHMLAERLDREGLTVLAINFRGYGKSRPGTLRGEQQEDVLAGIRYLTGRGATRISMLGASMGGGAVAEAAALIADGEIDNLILLAAVPSGAAERMSGRKLFIVSEGDAMRPSVTEQFERARDPKLLAVLPGDAHAQHIFGTEQGGRLTELIVDWLSSAEP